MTLQLSVVYDYYLKYSDHTSKQRDVYAYNNLNKYLENHNIIELKRSDIKKYVQTRRLMVSDSTINREIRSVRAAINMYKLDNDININNPFQKFTLREADNRDRFLTVKQIELLLESAKLANTPELYHFIMIALLTGLRSGQILKLKWEYINHTEGMIIINSMQNKGRKRLQLPISENALNAINKIPKISEYIFHAKNGHIKSLKKSFKNAANRAGLHWLRVHDLRHTFASHLVQNGVSLYHVQRLLGHARIDSTLRYAHLDHDHLKQALDSIVYKKISETSVIHDCQ